MPSSLLTVMLIPIIFSPLFYPRWVSLCLAFIWLASSLTLKIQAGTGWSEIFVTSAIAATSITAILIFIELIIHERAGAKDDLRQAMELYRTVADFTSYFEFWRNPDGTFQYVSPSSSKITGYKAEEFIANPQLFFDIVRPEDRQVLMAIYNRTAEPDDTLQVLEIGIQHRSGGLRWLEHSYRDIFSPQGKFLGKRASNRDITGQRQTEEALYHSEEMLRQITENIQEIFWVSSVDPDKMVYVSPAYEEIFGLTCESLYRDKYSYLRLVHPNDIPTIKGVEEQYRQTQSFKVEYRIIRTDGELRWVYTRGYPIYDSQGRHYRMVGTTEDITARKAIEDALQESERRYRDLIELQKEGILIISAGG
ncbi:MAG: PAS domain S-box protein, partial [Chloroflexi bacterium]|nr:PAS domain S-box protein [Chloroflexota bacterium]